MYLKRLELSGFKSFARSTILQFTTQVTGIVGPNGAGKSNIAEAVRFVLGEQSIKSLRGKKGVDLIFNGTKTLSRMSRASVTIVFDNTKKIFNIDYDEVEIKRIVHRDGINQYYINGAIVRLKDIIELLASVHIGASSHHIVSQGESDRILSVTPKERRVMMEDALGLKIYQLKRVESERKLSKTKENISHVESLRKEIIPHLHFLEKQVEKIKHTETLREELKELYATYLQNEYAYIAQQKKDLLEKKTSPLLETKDLDKKIEEQETILKSLEKDSGSSSETIALEQELTVLRGRKDTLSRQLGRLEGVLEYSEFPKTQKNEPKQKVFIVSEDTACMFSQKVLENLENTEKENEIIKIKEKLAELKAIMRAFFETHFSQKNEKIEDVGMRENEKHEKMLLEKKSVEEELAHVQKKEEGVYSHYLTKKEELEKGRDTERSAERLLFELRGKRIEMNAKLELIAVREERVEENEARFTNEHNEAVRIVGDGSVPTILALKEKIHNNEQLVQKDVQEKQKIRIERIKIKIEEIGSVGADITKEYEEVCEREQFLEREIEDLGKSANSLEQLIGELEDKIELEFKQGVQKINKEFKKFFGVMFEGGESSITITAPTKYTSPKKEQDERTEDEKLMETPEELPREDEKSGIEIKIGLPYKRVRGLSMLSGGERALTSMAFVFAVTQVHPPPFLILDETDAALDEINSKKYSDLLKKLSEKTQFIIITHNRQTMARAGVLYGVTSTSDGTSRLLSIKLEEAKQIAE